MQMLAFSPQPVPKLLVSQFDPNINAVVYGTEPTAHTDT